MVEDWLLIFSMGWPINVLIRVLLPDEITPRKFNWILQSWICCFVLDMRFLISMTLLVQSSSGTRFYLIFSVIWRNYSNSLWILYIFSTTIIILILPYSIRLFTYLRQHPLLQLVTMETSRPHISKHSLIEGISVAVFP